MKFKKKFPRFRCQKIGEDFDGAKTNLSRVGITRKASKRNFLMINLTSGVKTENETCNDVANVSSNLDCWTLNFPKKKKMKTYKPELDRSRQ